MDRNQISTQLRQLLSTIFHIPVIMEPEFSLDDPWERHLNSLDLVALVVECEREFQVTITDEQAEGIDTFNDLVTIIHDAKAIAA